MNDLFDYICDSVHKIVYHMTNTVILSALRQNCKSIVTDTVNEMYDNITDHCIFLIYYVLYRECAEKKSVRYYISQEIGLTVERELKEYDETLYAYKTFRKAEDEQMKNFFKDVPELADGIYKQFSHPEKGKPVERTEGQKLSLQAFIELSYMKKYSIIRLVTKKNFTNTKKFIPHEV